MGHGAVRLIAGLAALSVVGIGVGAYIVVPGGGEEEVAFQAETPSRTCAVFVKDVPCNPDAGLSDAERDAEYQRLRNEGDRIHREWLANLNIDTLDLRSLPRVEMPVLPLPSAASLSHAVAKADVIVGGKVSEIRPTEGVAIDTVFSVEHAIKGAVGSTVVISQAGRLQPTLDGSSVEIVEARNAPVLLPGDRAVLFLQKTEPVPGVSGQYYIQSSSGWYKVVNGEVQPNGFSAFADSVKGKTEADFIRAVATAVAEAASASP